MPGTARPGCGVGAKRALTQAPACQLRLLQAGAVAPLRRVVPYGLDVVHEGGGEAGGGGVGGAAAATARAAAARAARPPRRLPAAAAAAAVLPGGAPRERPWEALLLLWRRLWLAALEGAASWLGMGAVVWRRGSGACAGSRLVLHSHCVLPDPRQRPRGAWPGLLAGHRGGGVPGGGLAAGAGQRRSGGRRGRLHRRRRRGRGRRLAAASRGRAIGI